MSDDNRDPGLYIWRPYIPLVITSAEGSRKVWHDSLLDHADLPPSIDYRVSEPEFIDGLTFRIEAFSEPFDHPDGLVHDLLARLESCEVPFYTLGECEDDQVKPA